MPPDATSPSPDQVLAQNDPGDETGNRYRFQWTWAAISCCALLDGTEDVIEIFCEHHEDVLLKHRDGKFTGKQIKTRDSNQPVWKASDEQVKNSFTRFVELEKEFSQHFRAYEFLTNHPLHSAESATSLNFILNKIHQSTTFESLPRNVMRWIHSIAIAADTSDVIAYTALKKTKASDELPKLRDCLIRLIECLTGCWPAANDCSHEAVRRAARGLIEECGRASSLDHLQTRPAYILSTNHIAIDVLERIVGKRITVTRVREILDAGLHATATLDGNPENLPTPAEGSTHLLHQKLDVGGFSAVSRSSAEDLRDKADYLGIAWVKQHGREKGLQRYGHVRSLILNDASRAFEATRSEEHKFGPAMREDLRLKIQERRIRGDQLFDCTDEHLEGLAYSLSAQCRVHWSIERPWETI